MLSYTASQLIAIVSISCCFYDMLHNKKFSQDPRISRNFTIVCADAHRTATREYFLMSRLFPRFARLWICNFDWLLFDFCSQFQRTTNRQTLFFSFSPLLSLFPRSPFFSSFITISFFSPYFSPLVIYLPPYYTVLGMVTVGGCKFKWVGWYIFHPISTPG